MNFNLSSNRLLPFTIVIIILVFFIYQKHEKNNNAKVAQRECEFEFKKEVSGVVKKAFFDENPNHKGFEIDFTNGSKYRPIYLAKWQPVILIEGDSIYKKPSSFKYLIFRNRDGNPIFTIEDTINCENLK